MKIPTISIALSSFLDVRYCGVYGGVKTTVADANEEPCEYEPCTGMSGNEHRSLSYYTSGQVSPKHGHMQRALQPPKHNHTRRYLQPEIHELNQCQIDAGCFEDGKQVDLNGADFQQAIIDYINDPSSSPYGSVINCWDVRQVTDMKGAFAAQTDFNEPLKCWNTGSVTTMRDMFFHAYDFNQDIGDWDTQQVTDMAYMFSSTANFNQDISGWNVSQVIDMDSMFFLAHAFDQDIGSWSVSNVRKMVGMFEEAIAFNQDISSWDVTSVTNFGAMFFYATSFNQNLCPFGSIIDYDQINTNHMFHQSGCEVTTTPSKTSPDWCQPCDV